MRVVHVAELVPFGDVPEMFVVFTITTALRPTHRIRVGSLAYEIERSTDGRPVDHYRAGSIDMSRKMGESVRIIEVLPKARWVMYGKREVPGLSRRKNRMEKFSFGSLLPCEAVFVAGDGVLCTRTTSGQCSWIRWDSERRLWLLTGNPFEVNRDRVVTVVAYARPDIVAEERPVPGNRRRR